MSRLTAVALAALFATSALASEGPPYSGPDDVSYGDIPRASFGVPLIAPNGVDVVGSQYDDTQYAPTAQRQEEVRDDTRVADRAACCCHAG